MSQLLDPRLWRETTGDNPLLRLALSSQAGDRNARAELLNHLHACIKRGGDETISGALRSSPSHAVYHHLWECVCAAVDSPRGGAEPIIARWFAIPLVLVAGARERLTIPGIVPDIEAVTALLERHGAVGATRNFGLSNVLNSAEALERVTPGRVYRWAHDFTASGMPREFSAEAIEVAPGREQVHLRFLIGAGIAPQAAPSFLETAANIGAWGMPLTRALAQQLAQPGLYLLPVPRPPAAILKAAHLGRYARLELAYNLFVSNTVRRFRSAVGDPTVIISSHRSAAGGPEIRISLSSALDDTLLDGFRWPLYPLDGFDQIVAGITGLLHECRINDVRIVSQAAPENSEAGHGLFLAARDLDVIENALRRH